MNIRQLHYFLQIAELKSFTRAAAVLHIAQPALSRSIRGLEEELGVPLFLRSERGVALNEAGALLKDRAADLLAGFAQLRDEVAAQAKELSGELAFGMPPSMQEMVTQPLVRALRAEHPRLLLRLSEGISVALNEWMQTGKIDVAVVAANEPLAALAREPLLSEAMYLIGPPKAKLSLRRAVSLDRVAAEPLLVTLRPNSLRALVEDSLARAGHRLRPVLEANSTVVMVSMAAAGEGFTVLPYCAIHAAVRAKRVSAAPVDGLRVTWSLAYSHERRLSRAGAEWTRLLRHIAADAIERGEWKSAILA
ncbi:MAG: LysR substrate-binding domain-containing protein [Burkholderiales bacterium]